MDIKDWRHEVNVFDMTLVLIIYVRMVVPWMEATEGLVEDAITKRPVWCRNDMA